MGTEVRRSAACGDAVLALVGQLGQQLAHGLVALRVPEQRRDLGQGRQHKAAPGQGGVGQRQLLAGNDGIPYQQQVEIQRARTLDETLAAIAPQLPFDSQQSVQQGERLQLGFQREHCVQEGRLIAIADGLGLIERGARRDPAQATQTMWRSQRLRAVPCSE